MFNQEAIGQGNASKLVDVATPVDKDASMEPPGADPLHVSSFCHMFHFLIYLLSSIFFNAPFALPTFLIRVLCTGSLLLVVFSI
jgi:hypothetical protein